MELDWHTIYELFKFAPAIISLLLVILLQHKQLMKKDEMLETIIKLSDEDHARESKLITLLEILVQRRGE